MWYTPGMAWSKVGIRQERLTQLKERAEVEGRSAANMLDRILEAHFTAETLGSGRTVAQDTSRVARVPAPEAATDRLPLSSPPVVRKAPPRTKPCPHRLGPETFCKACDG